MARARVELRGAQSHNRGNRNFQQGAHQILTDEDEIKYYKSQSQFSVTMLEDPIPKPPAKTTVVAGKKKAEPSDEEPPL